MFWQQTYPDRPCKRRHLRSWMNSFQCCTDLCSVLDSYCSSHENMPNKGIIAGMDPIVFIRDPFTLALGIAFFANEHCPQSYL